MFHITYPTKWAEFCSQHNSDQWRCRQSSISCQSVQHGQNHVRWHATDWTERYWQKWRWRSRRGTHPSSVHRTPVNQNIAAVLQARCHLSVKSSSPSPSALILLLSYQDKLLVSDMTSYSPHSLTSMRTWITSLLSYYSTDTTHSKYSPTRMCCWESAERRLQDETRHYVGIVNCCCGSHQVCLVVSSTVH